MMLTFNRIFAAPPFIRQAKCGFLTHAPALRFCLSKFDLQAFSPEDFLHSGIPYPEQLHRASVKRQAEYLAGRYCAGALLDEAGSETIVLPFSRAAPVWPDGFCGSLSHTDDHAISVLAPHNAELSPGIDIETVRPCVMQEIATLFSTPDEREMVYKSILSEEKGLLVLFSAKESLYKSLWPQVQHFFDLAAASLTTIDLEQASLCITLTDDLSPDLQRGTTFTGHYCLEDRRVITCIY